MRSVAQSCPALCDLLDCSPPCSSVHQLSQARILEWVAISSSRGYSQPRDQTCVSGVSCISGRFFTCCTIGEAMSSLVIFISIKLLKITKEHVGDFCYIGMLIEGRLEWCFPHMLTGLQDEREFQFSYVFLYVKKKSKLDMSYFCSQGKKVFT